MTDDGMMRVRNNGCALPRKFRPNRSLKKRRSIRAKRDRHSLKRRSMTAESNDLPKIDNHQALRQLLSDPTIASKNWVYRQYDHTGAHRRHYKTGIGRRRVLRPLREQNSGSDDGLQFALLRASIPAKAARSPWPKRPAISPAPAQDRSP